MPNVAVSTNFGSLQTYVYPGGYDSTKLGLGPLMVQANDSGNEGKWVGPIPVATAKPLESMGNRFFSNTTPIQFTETCIVDAVKWSSTYDWVFVTGISTATNATASAGPIWLYRFNKTATSNQWSYVGSILCRAGIVNQQIKSLRASYEKYTTGTVAVTNNSTSVTGTGTTWSADRMYVGSRIGFGSTDPTQITTWYEIAAIGSDTSITLTQAYAGSTLSGQSYVIEDLKVLFTTYYSTTPTSTGLFMAAGLRYENFSYNYTIPAATTVDKVQATYWLSDGNAGSQGTMSILVGLAVDAKTSWTNQVCYSMEITGGTNVRFQVNNFRAASATWSGGRNAGNEMWRFNTGYSTLSSSYTHQYMNQALTICTPAHGQLNGLKSLVWVSQGYIQGVPVSVFASATTNHPLTYSAEFVPGKTTTFSTTPSNQLSSVAYDALSDYFYIFNVNLGGSNTSTAFRTYATKLYDDGRDWGRLFSVETKQLMQSTGDSTAPDIIPVNNGINFTGHSTAVCVEGITYIACGNANASSSPFNFVTAAPLAADWEAASTTNCRVVTPSMSVKEMNGFVAAYLNKVRVIGGKTGYNLGYEPGATRLYYRTSGIINNTGAWTLLDDSGAFPAIKPTDSIQFMIEYRMLTALCLPPRVTRVCIEGTPRADSGILQVPNLRPSEKYTDSSTRKFAFRYVSSFGGTVPTLYIRIYDAQNNNLLLVDNSASPVGTWEKSTDGSSWGSFNTTDRANETTYLRYTPVALSDSCRMTAIISLS